jgi:hypothetical protein
VTRICNEGEAESRSVPLEQGKGDSSAEAGEGAGRHGKAEEAGKERKSLQWRRGRGGLVPLAGGG